ncbi:nuclear transport factor 2 family protein [Thalassotalea hakodatensis]|uniref:nuclear transport factor 2 family protein n=1 Tax=Thalassotalea hakodatensis TaxID=3030492 RepID=UPI0025727458|nr:nuclear transport factor 2 family protein [Thalassotalea hakodatensis]
MNSFRLFSLSIILMLLSNIVGANDIQEDLNEIKQIERTLKHYIEGTAFNNKEKIEQAFYRDATLLLEKQNQDVWPVPASEYISWFNKKGKFNGRIGEILSIDLASGAATAKVEIITPKTSKRYIDLFLLKKLDSDWKIISKMAVSEKTISHGKRILFIVSNAHFHGDSRLPAGVSFSEVVKAFETFKQAGYTVDFLSPEGGAIPLSYINTSDPIHKKYLYDSDFMYAIGHTKSPNEVNAADYRAVHYVGGSNAMYQVAENKAIQKIAMDVYEKHNGIVSSVCHGTAGIVNLMTENGEYLVKGRRISGYPESFENQSKAYFKEFPFLIQKTIEERGGSFFHSSRNVAHVEVDGRIVTGQNHLSSTLVAQKMVEILAMQ